MKKFIIALMLLTAAPAALQTIAPVEAAAAAKERQTVLFKTNLHCKNCAKKVQENLAFVKGVTDLKVSLENQEIIVTFDPAKTSVEKLQAEIKRLGYAANIVPQSAPAELLQEVR